MGFPLSTWPVRTRLPATRTARSGLEITSCFTCGSLGPAPPPQGTDYTTIYIFFNGYKQIPEPWRCYGPTAA